MARRAKTIPIAILQTEIDLWLEGIPRSTFDLRAQGQRQAFEHLRTYLETYARLHFQKVVRDDAHPG